MEIIIVFKDKVILMRKVSKGREFIGEGRSRGKGAGGRLGKLRVKSRI